MRLNRTLMSQSLAFVPRHNPVSDIDVKLLGEFLSQFKKLMVLTGAGISTESGIPDYRSDGVGLYARSNSRPIKYQKFIQSYEARKRYWARNYIGWPRFSSFQPNPTHKILRDLELTYRKVSCIITQNVDNLHFKAGSKRVIELHGTAFKVSCLSCGVKYNRYHVQDLIKAKNPNVVEFSQFIRPDGDVEISDDVVNQFIMPACPSCNGTLKPDIVFFGENVPKETVLAVNEELDLCDSVLVLGSSLSTYSGYRITLKCKELGKPLAIINIGHTRADNIADVKIERRCGELLSKLELSKLYQII